MDTSFSSLLGALYRRRFTVILVTAGSVGGGIYYDQVYPKTFVAKAQIFISTASPRISLNNGSINVPRGPIIPDATEGTRVALVGIIQTGAVFDRVAERVPGLDADRLRRNFIADIDFYQQLNVAVYEKTKERAAQLANEFILAVKDVMKEMVERSPQETLATFEQQEPLAWDRYRVAQQALVDYLATVGSPDVENSLQILLGQRRQVENTLADLDLEEERSGAEREVIQRLIGGRPEFVLSRRSYTLNPAFRSVQDQIADLESQLAVARLDYKEEHPVVRNLVTELEVRRDRALALAENELELIHSSSTEVLDDQTRTLTNRLVDLDLSASSIASRREVLLERLDYLESELAVMPVNRAEIERLNGEIQRTRKYAEDLRRRIEELEVQLERGLDFTYTDNARMAKVEDVKQVPATVGIYLFTSMAGIIFGTMLALGLEILSRMRKSYPF